MAKKCVETYLLLNAAAQYPKPGCTTNHKEKSMIVMMFYRELVWYDTRIATDTKKRAVKHKTDRPRMT